MAAQLATATGSAPLVVSRRQNNTRYIATLDEQAETLGLKRGMGIADACAMHPTIEIVEADPPADRRMLESLADWCDRYTPLVALDGEDGLYLDITGCAHLFGGEKAMLEDVLARFFHQGFDLCAGIASTAGAAWAAARFSLSPIEEGGEEEALAPLPLPALRLDPAARGGLKSVGLRTVGAVMQTPRAPLTRRFGKLLFLRIDQALGRVEEPISPRLPAPPLAVERRLAEPIMTMEEVERLVRLLAVTLQSDLERRGEGARALQLTLFRVDGVVVRIVVGTARPLRDPDRIGLLFHEKLTGLEGRIDAGFGFDLIRLSALSLSPFEAWQGDFSGDYASEEERLALFADRIRARLGGHAVLKIARVESHLPERAAATIPFADCRTQILPFPGAAGGRIATAASLVERPIRLFTSPEPIEAVAAGIPEGAPASFRWRRVLHRVAASEGPERIAPEWWRGDGEETRDYFRVEDDEGRRYWLYREGFYGEAWQGPRWFMHGIFA